MRSSAAHSECAFAVHLRCNDSTLLICLPGIAYTSPSSAPYQPPFNPPSPPLHRCCDTVNGAKCIENKCYAKDMQRCPGAQNDMCAAGLICDTGLCCKAGEKACGGKCVLGLGWFGLVWFGLVWFGLLCFGLESLACSRFKDSTSKNNTTRFASISPPHPSTRCCLEGQCSKGLCCPKGQSSCGGVCCDDASCINGKCAPAGFKKCQWSTAGYCECWTAAFA